MTIMVESTSLPHNTQHPHTLNRPLCYKFGQNDPTHFDVHCRETFILWGSFNEAAAMLISNNDYPPLGMQVAWLYPYPPPLPASTPGPPWLLDYHAESG